MRPEKVREKLLRNGPLLIKCTCYIQLPRCLRVQVKSAADSGALGVVGQFLMVTKVEAQKKSECFMLADMNNVRLLNSVPQWSRTHTRVGSTAWAAPLAARCLPSFF